MVDTWRVVWETEHSGFGFLLLTISRQGRAKWSLAWVLGKPTGEDSLPVSRIRKHAVGEPHLMRYSKAVRKNHPPAALNVGDRYYACGSIS
jgi:hypothetical protein